MSRFTLRERIAGAVKRKKPKKEDELWALLKEAKDVGLECRKPFEQRWIICLAFLVGRQYMFFNQSAHLLQELRRVKGKLRSVDNQLIGRWRRQVADLIKTAPIMSVVPDTTDDEDIKAAKIGDKVLKSWWRTAKMKKKVRQMAGWIYSCGNVFLDDRWNPKLGPLATDEKTGKLVYQGDVDCGVWSPFEILVPFSAMGETELDDFPWMIKIKYRQLDWIASHYKRGGEVVAESIPFPYNDLTQMMGHFSGTAVSKLPGAMVMDFYLQPTSKFPKGLFLTGANGIILERDDYPLNHYHLGHFKDIDVPGIFWGKSTEEEAIGLQKTWNRTTTSVNEFNRIVAKGKGLLPRGSKLEVIPDDKHGQWLLYNPVLGHKPEWMTHKGLPGTLQWAFERTEKSLNNLYSQHEPTQGTNKSDMRSGTMVAFLREQDAHGAIPTHAVFEESMEEVASRVLKRIQTGYSTERMLKVEGREGEFDVFAFKGSDLRNNTDVSVKKDSTLPDSRTAREDQILRKFEAGLYGDQRDPKVRRLVMEMLDDAVTKDIFSEVRLDETVARWENETMFRSDIDLYLINNYDNDEVHVEEHNKFRKGMDYQRLKVENPERFKQLEMIVMTHVEGHQTRLKEQQEAMMEQQARFERMSKEGGK